MVYLIPPSDSICFILDYPTFPASCLWACECVLPFAWHLLRGQGSLEQSSNYGEHGVAVEMRENCNWIMTHQGWNLSLDTLTHRPASSHGDTHRSGNNLWLETCWSITGLELNTATGLLSFWMSHKSILIYFHLTKCSTSWKFSHFVTVQPQTLKDAML